MGQFSRKTLLQKIQEKNELERQAEAEKQARIKEQVAGKRKRKRIVFFRRIAAVSTLLIVFFTVFSFANGLLDKEHQEEKEASAIEKKIAQYDQVEVFIQEGDTAWSIQEQLTPGTDVRDMLYLVKRINHRKELGKVKAGEVLTFLKTKE